MLLVGVDGCKSGWLCVTDDTGALAAKILPNFDAVVALNAKVTTIDIPIGLPESGPRTCDVEARRLLRAPRASSVFPAPVRLCLDTEDYAMACALHQQADGRKLSRQAFGILPKIREVDNRMRAEIGLQRRIREVHPELCFAKWNDGIAMRHRKSAPAGRDERAQLLESEWPGAVSTLAGRLPKGLWAMDDLLDALVALWTARRQAAGIAHQVPANPPIDRYGLRMEMVA